MSTERRVGELDDVGVEPIDVRMHVTPAEESSCPPYDLGSITVKQSFHMENGGDRPCQMVLEGDDAVEYRQFDACERCPCFVMETRNCIAELRGIRDGRLHYAVLLPDRSELAPLVTALRDAGATVSVTRILSAGETENEPATLTDTQRETLMFAIDAGYYDRPRGATLDDIATELDITRSAASQRLNSVKRRLIDTYVRQTESGSQA